MVEGDRVERPEHELHHWTDAEHGGADTHADEAGFRDRGVNDAFGAEFFEEAFGDFVGAVELGDFLTHEDDIFVAGKFFGESGADSFAVGENSHWKFSNFRFTILDFSECFTQSKKRRPFEVRWSG